jgi:tungstate transport system substrate-binding protein
VLYRLILEMEGQKRFSGNDLFLILENIVQYGSISKAASMAEVSYRYAWGLLQEAEKALDIVLLDKQVGGYAGGGTLLTPGGKKLLQEYKDFKAKAQKQLDEFMQKTGQVQERAARELVVEEEKNFLLLATTMEPVETGLLDELESAFYRYKGIYVRHLAAGSGRALEIARGGRVDMALTHAPELEAEFLREGWGAHQVPVMSNDFVVVGPREDPAGIGQAGRRKAADLFQMIYRSGALFVSRGDHSGTHLREVAIWEKAGITPKGDGYLFYPGVSGNLGALRFAREKKAYMLTDLASYYLAHSEDVMKIYLDTGNAACEEELRNHFVLTLVNPEKVPSARYQDASRFARWLTKGEGKKIIENFGKDVYAKPLFIPAESRK